MTKRMRYAAMVLALMMLLSGCRKQTATIIMEPIVEEPEWMGQSMDVAQPQPEQQQVYQDPAIVPAPATAEEIYQAASEAAQRANPVPVSDYAPDIARGDMNIGIVMGEDASLNPIQCTYQDMMNLSTQVFEGLIALDENRMPIPQLADRWEVKEKEWTFTLRSGIMFHDGSYLTPDDVVASFEAVKENPDSYWYPALDQIKGIKVVNENTVRVLSETAGYMTLYAMTFPIIQRSSMYLERPVGTGPYLITQYSPGNAIRLEISPIWWKRADGSVKSIVGLIYGDSAQVIAAMERMEIDTIATEYPSASIARSLADRTTMDYSTLTYECIVPNLRHPVLADKAVREALMYGIDRNTLAQTIYTSMAQESEVPVIPGSGLYEPQAAQYAYNPQRALKILEDDGWQVDYSSGQGILGKEINGKYEALKLRLFTSDRGTTSTRSEACRAIKDQLAKIGVSVTIKRMSHGDLIRALRDQKFDLALCAFEMGDFPNLYFLLHSNGNSNFSRYNSGEMDDYLREAYDATTWEGLVTAMSAIQMKCVNDLPLLGLFFRTGILSSRVALDGIVKPRRGYALGNLAMGGGFVE